MELVGPDNEVSFSPLLDQPEVDVPRSVTWTRLFEDLLYDGIAWFKVTETDYRAYPTKVARIDPERVTITDGKVYVDGRQVRHDQVIRFDSPNGSLLADGSRAIKTLLRLEAAAAIQAEDPTMQGYFYPADGADPADDDEIREMLGAWRNARQQNSTGYVPASLKYQPVSYSPEQLQMSEARQHAVLEIARLTGIDSEDLSVSTTSRTYFNGQDRRMQRISDVLGPYIQAVTDRLRMRDITPRGYNVKADFSGFLRADDQTRLENYVLGVKLGLYNVEQIAEREGLPAPELSELTQARREVIREAEQIAITEGKANE